MRLICDCGAFEVRMRCVWERSEVGMSNMSDILITHIGAPIEEKVSGLEGCHVANPDF